MCPLFLVWTTLDAMMELDFTKPALFESVKGWRFHEASTLLMTITALTHGLAVRFFRGPNEAGLQNRVFSPSISQCILYSVTDGQRSRFFEATISDQVSLDAALTTKDKLRTKALLHRKNLATPVGGLVSADKMHLLDALVSAGVRRFVLKPISGSMGKDTFINQSAEAVRAYLTTHAGEYLLEQSIAGTELRLVVVQGRVVAARQFIPLHVVGNGVDTIAQLLEERLASRAHNPLAGHLRPEAAGVELVLLMQKLTWNSVPKVGERIWLTTKTTPDAHGDSIDVSDSVSLHTKQLAIDAAQALGASVCAIDMMVDSRGQRFVLELNLRPMIGALSFPSIGKFNVHVPTAILESHFKLNAHPKRQVLAYDFKALKEEVFREGRTSKGVNAADFATFA